MPENVKTPRNCRGTPSSQSLIDPKCLKQRNTSDRGGDRRVLVWGQIRPCARSSNLSRHPRHSAIVNCLQLAPRQYLEDYVYS